jgi:hypothetical protein
MSIVKQNKPGKTTAFFICVCFAAFLWLLHNLNRSYTHVIQIPVQFVNLPASKLPSHPLPEKLNLNLKLSGLKILFYNLKKDNPLYTIDFNGLKTDASRHLYSLSSFSTALKEHLLFHPEIIQIVPDSIVLTDKKGQAKNVPVKARLFVKAAPGYNITQQLLLPSFVTVYGDSAALSEIDTVYTEPLTLNNLQTVKTFSTELIKTQSEIVYSTNAVQVQLRSEKLIEQTLQLPVQINNIPNGYVAKCFPGSVTLKYTAASGETVNPSSLLLGIDCKSNPSASQKIPVEVLVKPGSLYVLQTEPQEVELILIKK